MWFLDLVEYCVSMEGVRSKYMIAYSASFGWVSPKITYVFSSLHSLKIPLDFISLAFYSSPSKMLICWLVLSLTYRSFVMNEIAGTTFLPYPLLSFILE